MSTRVVSIGSAIWADTPPEARVRIDRTTKWGNPFRLGRDGDRATVILFFREYLRDRPDLIAEARAELCGKILGCWCAPDPCHGDVLAAVAEGAQP